MIEKNKRIVEFLEFLEEQDVLDLYIQNMRSRGHYVLDFLKTHPDEDWISGGFIWRLSAGENLNQLSRENKIEFWNDLNIKWLRK